MSTQDNGREKRQIEMFGLKSKSRNNRGCKYLPDAELTIDGRTYNFELKSGSKNSFSTARGFSAEKIEEWKKNDFFIFSQFDSKDRAQPFIKHVICQPESLKFFFEKVTDAVNTKGHAGKIGLSEWDKDIKPLLKGLPSEFLQRVEKTVKVGAQYNDPKISLKKIIEHGGHVLDNEKPLKEQLVKFIQTQKNTGVFNGK